MQHTLCVSKNGLTLTIYYSFLVNKEIYNLHAIVWLHGNGAIGYFKTLQNFGPNNGSTVLAYMIVYSLSFCPFCIDFKIEPKSFYSLAMLVLCKMSI